VRHLAGEEPIQGPLGRLSTASGQDLGRVLPVALADEDGPRPFVEVGAGGHDPQPHIGVGQLLPGEQRVLIAGEDEHHPRQTGQVGVEPLHLLGQVVMLGADDDHGAVGGGRQFLEADHASIVDGTGGAPRPAVHDALEDPRVPGAPGDNRGLTV
jgi:hypothetical protein